MVESIPVYPKLFICKINKYVYNDKLYIEKLFNSLPKKLQLTIRGLQIQSMFSIDEYRTINEYKDKIEIYESMKELFININLDEVLLIKNNNQEYDIEKIELRKYINGNVDIYIKYYNDSYLRSVVYSNLTNLSYDNNTVIIKNIDINEATIFLYNIIIPFYDEMAINKTNSAVKNFYVPAPESNEINMDRVKIQNAVYILITGTLTDNTDIFKLLLLSDFNQAIEYLNKHIEVLPSFIDIVYYEYQDTRYYKIMHEKINEVIIDDKLLSKFKNDEINKMYYVLAQIIYNSSTELSDDEKIAVLEYLFNSGDYADAKELRQRISLGIMGYGLNETPGVEINLDIPTLYFLMKTHKK